MSYLSDLVESAAIAKIAALKHSTFAARLDAAAKAEAERLRLTGHAGDRHTTKVGVLRCDGLNRPPTPVVEDEEAFASWVAQRRPDAVTATITVPADKLEAAIECIEFAGISDYAAQVRVKSPTAELKDVELVPDAEAKSGWVALAPPEENAGVPAVPPVVPGVGGVAAPIRWVLTPQSAAKKAVEEEAEADADGFLADLKPAAAVTGPKAA